MANPEHIESLQRDVREWNSEAGNLRTFAPDLRDADLMKC